MCSFSTVWGGFFLECIDRQIFIAIEMHITPAINTPLREIRKHAAEAASLASSSSPFLVSHAVCWSNLANLVLGCFVSCGYRESERKGEKKEDLLLLSFEMGLGALCFLHAARVSYAFATYLHLIFALVD